MPVTSKAEEQQPFYFRYLGLVHRDEVVWRLVKQRHHFKTLKSSINHHFYMTMNQIAMWDVSHSNLLIVTSFNFLEGFFLPLISLSLTSPTYKTVDNR